MKRFFKVVNLEKIDNINNKYKVTKHNILNNHNRYHITDNEPTIKAAKKALKQIFKKTNEYKEYTIILKETTKLSDNKLFFYKGTIQLLPENKWKIIKFNNKTSNKNINNYNNIDSNLDNHFSDSIMNTKDTIFKHKINIEIISNDDLGHSNPLSNWSINIKKNKYPL